jgi:hypothetical protein
MEGWLSLAQRRKSAEIAEQISIASIAGCGDAKAIKKAVKKLTEEGE